MPKLFISYRRADSAYVTDSIYDYMVRHFGKDNVFLDVGSIPFGVDFREFLRDQIAANDVILVIIGPEWARLMQERASQSNDFVRIEIENALIQNKFVVPVLVMNAEMPDFSTLPSSIQELQWRNSAVVRRQPDLEHDCNRLAEGIKSYLARPVASSPVAIPVTTPALSTPPAASTIPMYSAHEPQVQTDATAFDVMLMETGPQKINVIKAVRALTNLGLKDAKDLVEAAPQTVMSGVSKEIAHEAKSALEQVGGVVQLQPFNGESLWGQTVDVADMLYSVILRDTGPQKINVIKAVRALTDLGLSDAKILVESTPSTMLFNVTHEVAQHAKALMEENMAVVEIVPQM